MTRKTIRHFSLNFSYKESALKKLNHHLIISRQKLFHFLFSIRNADLSICLLAIKTVSFICSYLIRLLLACSNFRLD